MHTRRAIEMGRSNVPYAGHVNNAEIRRIAGCETQSNLLR